MQTRRQEALWIAAIWAALALINATQSIVSLRNDGITRPLGLLFAITLLSWLAWACATPLVLWLGRRFPPARHSGPARWAVLRTGRWVVHLAAAITIGYLSSTWGASLIWIARPFGAPPSRQSFFTQATGRFLGQAHFTLIIYAAILAVAYVIESRQRAARLATQLAQAQLDALRRQLEPHFLFNTLNAIAGLVRDRRNDAAVGMIAGLSDLLRRVLEDGGRQQIPLAEEMEFLERYLEIQQMRFAGRLRVALDVPRELDTAQVPSLILQPLVENAIQHGIGRRVEGGALRIAAARSNGALTIRIYNEGPPLSGSWSEGIGIANTRARLASLFGPDGDLAIRNCESGVEAVMTLPFRAVPT